MIPIILSSASTVGEALIATGASCTFGWLGVAVSVAFGTYSALSRIGI